MKSSVILSILAFSSVLLVSCSKPEDPVVDHLESVNSIMQDNMDSPEKGINKLIEYFEENGAEAASQLVNLGIELAKIEGDGDREERAKEVREAFEIPMKNLEGTAEKFAEKASSNKEARELMEEFEERWEHVFNSLGRLGDSGMRF